MSTVLTPSLNPLYGHAGIATYWIVNLPDSRIEVYTESSDTGYRTVRYYGKGESVPVILDGKEIGTIATAALFGE